MTLTHRRCSVCGSRYHDKRGCKVLAKYGTPSKATARTNPAKRYHRPHARLRPAAKAHTIRKGYRT